MISLRKFWTADNSASGEPDVSRLVRLMMQGIALHAVEGNPVDHQNFRREMQNLLEDAEANPSSANLLAVTGSALKALEEYNQRTSRNLRMQGAELQHMVGMLTRTVAALGTGSERAVGKLREIETKLERASAVDDIRALKLRMEECLQGIREEAERQKLASTRTTAELTQEIEQTQERIRAAAGGLILDPTTGLPTRANAIAAMEDAAAGSKPVYAGLFVVDRVALINTRLGYAAGDKVLTFYMEELRNRLLATDRVFRWSGPAFLVLLTRAERLEKVREQLRLMVPGKLERNIELANRSALVAVTATWAVFKIAVPIDGVIEQLDKFLSTHSPPVG